MSVESESKQTTYSRDHYLRNRERVLAKNRAWAKANPEKVRRASRNRHYQVKYGISLNDYESMLASQDHGCGACGGETLPGFVLAVDHCHETGRVRGLLCDACNRAVGLLGDSAERADLLADYLRRNGDDCG
jgi:hypothetical protein